MKTTKSDIKNLLIVFVLVIIGLCMSSCDSKSGKWNQKPPENTSVSVFPVRARVLENSTMSYVDLTFKQKLLFQSGDTIWLNLDTHLVDDTAQFTMKAELEY